MRNVTVLVETIFQVFPEPRVEPAPLRLTSTCPPADMDSAQTRIPTKLSWAAEIYLDRTVLSSPTDCGRHAGVPAGRGVEAWMASREAGSNDAETGKPEPVA